MSSAERDLSEELRRLERLAAEFGSELGALPALATPDMPLSDETIAAAVQRLGDAADAAELLATDTASALAAHQGALETLSGAERERHREVGAAIPEVRLALERVAAGITSAAVATAVEVPPGPPGTDAVVTDLAGWASRLVPGATDALIACRAGAEVAEAAASAARRARDEALAGIGVEDTAALNQEIGAVRVRRADAGTELDEAQRQIPVAARLDAAIEEAEPLLDALSEVIDLLSPGQFPKWVIEQRQRKLLELAADRLGEMTGDRLRFAEDFQVYDRRTDMSRDPNTLSGGEMFMASLALALTLVEMSTGTGDPQGALFLDEGFSTLDGDCLAEAMQVLDTQTAGGRVVAIISHLRTVADYVDQVLWAEKGMGTSTLRTLSSEEIDRLLSNDAASGLVV